MENTIVAVVAVLFGSVIGLLGGYLGRRVLAGRRYKVAVVEADSVLNEAKEEQRQIVLSAKEEALKIRSTGAAEIREQREELQGEYRRISNREENLENRSRNLDRRDKDIVTKEKLVSEIQVEVDDIKTEQLRKLEEISGLSIGDVKEDLMRRAELEIERNVSLRYRDAEEQAREDANEKARDILALSIHRLASDVVSEVSLTTVPLPTDDMKGRLIGREGRNIRAIEQATGVDLIIDDTPEAVTVSCFDPLRREVARIAIAKLIADGRIHPARIEETVERTQKELADLVKKTGDQTIMDVGVSGMNVDMVRLLGRLKYRYSYGENVLQHSVEVAYLAAAIASEIGADIKVAKAGGLFHDIGKALSHEVEGPHAEIGADVAKKNGLSPEVCIAIREHHDDVMSTPEAFIVSAADAISAARPGSRRDTVEHYIKRLEALEDVGRAFDGVEKCFAIQAGREMRVMVKPESVDDLAANKMAREIVKKIEDTLAYPGQIKVTVIRESRVVEFAK